MRSATLLVASMALVLVGVPAHGQDESPRRGQRQQRPQRQAQLAPEMAAAAWQLEAEGVARGLGLPEDAAAKLVKTYAEARDSFNKAARAMRDEARAARNDDDGGDEADNDDDRDVRGGQGARGNRRGGQGGAAAMAMNRELIGAEKKKLETALHEFLTVEQVEKSIVSLGTFNDGWDRMVHAIAGFNLGEEKLNDALKQIEAYIVTTAKLADTDDRRAMMQDMREAREALDKQLAAILSEEQMSSFLASTSRGPGRGAAGGFADRLRQYDENGDGKIQKSELPEEMQEFFDRLDANGDGVIDETELNAMGNGRGGRGGARGDDF